MIIRLSCFNHYVRPLFLVIKCLSQGHSDAIPHREATTSFKVSYAFTMSATAHMHL